MRDMTPDEIRSTAAIVAGTHAREIHVLRIREIVPVSQRDAVRIQEAILTAEIGLTWQRPGIDTKTKVVAVLASPIIIPVVATLWLIWRIDRVVQAIRGRASRSSS